MSTKPRYPLPEITDHAMARFLDLWPAKAKLSKGRIKRTLWTFIANARPAVLKPQFRARQMAAHAGREVDYRMDRQGRIFVLRGNTLLTVHSGRARRWRVVE